VNGGLPGLLLIEFYKEVAGRQPASFELRNVGPLYCGQPCRLSAIETGTGWALAAENGAGGRAAEGTAS
jgi:hydroxyacyl-ACP dehydratase HTD2-like protein with hotdog domain